MPKISYVDDELIKQIEEMVKKIKESFGIIINKRQASKIVAWKSKCFNLPISEKRLLEVIGKHE